MNDQQNGPAGQQPYDPGNSGAPQGFGTPPQQQQPGYPTGQPQQPAVPAYPPHYGSQPYPAAAGAPYPGYAAPQEYPQGTTILILGLVAIAFSPLGIVAWIMGSKAEKEMAATGLTYSNAGSVKAGKILGIVFTVITIVAVLATIAYVIFFLLLFGSIAAQGY